VIIAEEFAKGALEMVEIGKRDLGDVTAKLESYGVKFNEVDKKAFTEATKSIYETFPGLTPGIYDKLQAELEKIRAK
jgi:TRAP-type C4-dicarboxylate transport system substrate-binding protein